jgi:hypothetical protein
MISIRIAVNLEDRGVCFLFESSKIKATSSKMRLPFACQSQMKGEVPLRPLFLYSIINSLHFSGRKL